ncbi:hypothetical protein LJ737_15255 [Hymenobacter sp. 15J16-1T3B]|uniref:hypothetical protein n=1 Tax=Hymenobacter sp. 15J16-1T3B TaxID=2886941 RepID=UPI001D10F8F5|nr:hypothetical protein [Hymenobacter sp. 15J16-1T3B]MCC3158606.1 hypothetical protein [Hymenobacter sp. 15J16-1T3B]
MFLNQTISVSGCITQEKFIKGRTLSELERLLGFHAGRLEKGIIVAALLQLPDIDQFELLGYTQVAEHNFSANALNGLDINKLKAMVRQNVFTTVGNDRLVKIKPNTPHSEYMSNDEQYPPGSGVPQWKLISKMDAEVIAIVDEGECYPFW